MNAQARCPVDPIGTEACAKQVRALIDITNSRIQEQACDRRNAWVNRKVAEALPIETVSAKIRDAKPAIVFLGEAHYANTAELYNELINTVRVGLPETDCLFVEFPQSSAESIERFVADRNAQIADTRITAFFPLIRGAHDQGLKIFPVDLAQVPDLKTTAERIASVGPRNIAMADEIERRMKKDCRTAVMVVGKLHLVDYKDGVSKLQTLLGKKGVKSFSINVESTLDGSTHLFSRTKCKTAPNEPSRPTVFANDTAPADLAYEPGKNGQFRAMEITVVYPKDY